MLPSLPLPCLVSISFLPSRSLLPRQTHIALLGSFVQLVSTVGANISQMVCAESNKRFLSSWQFHNNAFLSPVAIAIGVDGVLVVAQMGLNSWNITAGHAFQILGERGKLDLQRTPQPLSIDEALDLVIEEWDGVGILKLAIDGAIVFEIKSSVSILLEIDNFPSDADGLHGRSVRVLRSVGIAKQKFHFHDLAIENRSGVWS
jgi:hypothetical protein